MRWLTNGLVLLVIAPFMAACLAVVVVIILAASTGVSGARSSGFRQDGLHYVMTDKPPVPRAVPASQWWISYAAETTFRYAGLAIVFEVLVIGVAVQFYKGADSSRQFVHRLFRREPAMAARPSGNDAREILQRGKRT